MVYSMPSKFGAIARCAIQKDSDSFKRNLNLYILCKNSDNNLVPANLSIKQNLKNYIAQYKIITDAISIKDAFVVNIGVNFEIIIRPNFSGRDVLLNCTNELKEFFDIAKWSINQPINLSLIYTLLDRVKGVQTVENIEITNKQGGVYSRYA